MLFFHCSCVCALSLSRRALTLHDRKALSQDRGFASPLASPKPRRARLAMLP